MDRPARCWRRPSPGFGPDELRAWCGDLGQEPFVGTSGRVFPSGFRATPLLRAWLGRLGELGVDVQVRHTWRGWASGGVRVADGEGVEREEPAEAVVLALGGASWPRTGSDGAWVDGLRAAGVGVGAAASGQRGRRGGMDAAVRRTVRGHAPEERRPVDRSGARRSRHGPRRRDGDDRGARGRRRLRGRAGAARPAPVRAPTSGDPTSTCARTWVGRGARRSARPAAAEGLCVELPCAAPLGLAPVGHRAAARGHGQPPPGPTGLDLARLVKAVPVEVVGVQPIARAISTAGGIALAEVDDVVHARGAGRARSSPARCSTGRRRPVATCCRPRSAPRSPPPTAPIARSPGF